MTPVVQESAADYLRRMAVTRTNPTRKAWQEAAKVLDGFRFKSEPSEKERSSGKYVGHQGAGSVIPVFMDDVLIGSVNVIVDVTRDLHIFAGADYVELKEDAHASNS
jgi:hypothetical protein